MRLAAAIIAAIISLAEPKGPCGTTGGPPKPPPPPPPLEPPPEPGEGTKSPGLLATPPVPPTTACSMPPALPAALSLPPFLACDLLLWLALLIVALPSLPLAEASRTAPCGACDASCAVPLCGE